jgi:hypothetical protein
MTRELQPFRDARLRCGIGHLQRGRVRVVQDQGTDMDGEHFWYPPSDHYDPETCIVCGLKIWSASDEPIR